MSEWLDVEGDLRRVLEHPGFIELSRHPELEQPWVVGLNLFPWDVQRITWYHAQSLPAALTLAIVGIERLGGTTGDRDHV